MDDEGSIPPSGDDKATSDDSTSDSETELMVTTRSRRTTAGNRYSALVAQEDVAEDEEDEVAMLFAEGEGEDEDFNSDEGDEDADMSSSDDDDQGPNVAADDMDGEQDLLKEAKAERAKKRKADLALTTIAGLKKKPKIDPTSLRRAPAAKPTKRKERVSWLPNSEAAPGRTSLRKQTILHRAETHAKLKENEAQRLKMKAKRQKRELEREAEAPKQMTQADRLAEAERVERRNAKSLNRWEAMEKRRAEEQAEKLAALKERKLEGAVITWYSSSARYLGLKESKDFEYEPPPEGKKRGRKPKALLEQLAAAKLAQNDTSMPVSAPSQAITVTANSNTSSPQHIASNNDHHEQQNIEAKPGQVSKAPPESNSQLNVTPQNELDPMVDVKQSKSIDGSFLNGIHEYASMQSSSSSKDIRTATKVENPMSQTNLVDTHGTQDLQSQDSVTAEASTKHDTANDKQLDSLTTVQEDIQKLHTTQTEMEPNVAVPLPESTSNQKETTPVDTPMSNTDDQTSKSTEPDTNTNDTAQSRLATKENDLGDKPDTLQTPQSTLTTDADQSSTTAPSVEPPIEVTSTKNLIILDKFDELSEQARYDFGPLSNRKPTKPIKHVQELCPITGLPARYRDPSTGIGYANVAAYKKIRDLKSHHYTWSSMLNCYVGRAATVARGVPDGFLSN